MKRRIGGLPYELALPPKPGNVPCNVHLPARTSSFKAITPQGSPAHRSSQVGRNLEESRIITTAGVSTGLDLLSRGSLDEVNKESSVLGTHQEHP